MGAENALIAGAATNVAHQLVNEDAPRIAGIDIIASGDQITASLQLAASSHELFNLVDWAERLGDDITVTVTRREEFVSVHVGGHASDTPIKVWTHLPESDQAALWEVTDHPELDTPTAVPLDALRSAAEAVAGTTAAA